MRPNGTQVYDRLLFTPQHQGQERVGDKEKSPDIHFPGIPPIFDIDFPHRLERLQPPSIVYQYIQSSLPESRLRLLCSTLHALLIKHIELEL